MKHSLRDACHHGHVLTRASQHVDFVVPDHLLQDARSAILEDRGNDFCIAFTDCPSTDACPSVVDRTEFVPDLHFHTDFCLPEERKFPQIFIHGQSQVLWTLPPLDESYLPPPFGQNEELFHRTISTHYVLTTDKAACPPREYENIAGPGYPPKIIPKRFTVGVGVWDESLYPAIAPKPRFAVEALARLTVRHYCDLRYFDFAVNARSLGEAQRKNEFISFEGLHRLMRRVAQYEAAPLTFRETMLELARLFGEDSVVDQLERENRARELYYPKAIRDLLP